MSEINRNRATMLADIANQREEVSKQLINLKSVAAFFDCSVGEVRDADGNFILNQLLLVKSNLSVAEATLHALKS